MIDISDIHKHFFLNKQNAWIVDKLGNIIEIYNNGIMKRTAVNK